MASAPRWTRLCGALLLASCTSQSMRDGAPEPGGDPAPSLIGSTIGLDHVLIWAGNPAAAEATLTTLGFHLGQAGSYGSGILNKLVRFENRSYIEFLWLSDRELAKESAPWAYDFVSQHNGSNSFGVQVESIAGSYSALSAAGLKPDEPTAEAWDPDGPEGPKPPVVNKWRYMFLASNTLPGDPFFVEYFGPKRPQQPAPTFPVHPNRARKLSAVWVLVEDLEGAKRAYQRAGFSPGAGVDFPDLQGKGLSMESGEGDIILMVPTGPGIARDRLKVRGPHVAGISIQVADLDTTARLLEAGFGAPAPRQQGRFGMSLRPQTLGPLGLWIEFHE